MKILSPFVLGMSLLGQPLAAAPPPAITDAELAAIQADAASRAPTAAAANSTARAELEKDLADGVTASKAAATFLVQADLPPTPADAVPPPAKPLEVNPSPDQTVIHFEGGMYFDPEEGVLVYLKNVTVKDPRFNLSGADELKIFFEKKPVETEGTETPAPAEESSKIGGKIAANFGDVERIIATGAILIEQKPTAAGQEPIKASGGVFTYNIKTDQIVIQGRYPWFLQGTTYMRAKEPDLLIRISPKAGSAATGGGVWDMGLPLDQKK